MTGPETWGLIAVVSIVAGIVGWLRGYEACKRDQANQFMASAEAYALASKDTEGAEHYRAPVW